MKIIIVYLIRSIRKTKFRAVIVLVSFIMISATLYTNFAALNMVDALYENNIRDSFGTIDIIISNRDTEEMFLCEKDILWDGVDVQAIVPVFNFIGSFKTPESGAQRIRIISSNIELIYENNLVILSESHSFSNGSGIIVSNAFAEQFGYRVGDNIELRAFDTSVDITITHLADSRGLFDSQDMSNIAVVSEDVIENIFATEFLANALFVSLSCRDSIDESLRVLSMNNLNYEVVSVLDEEYLEMMQMTVRLILLAALLLMVFLSTVLICALYSHILDDRIPVMGVFRSIGVSQGKLNIILVTESLIYATTGGVFGAILGRIFSSRLLGMIIDVPAINSIGHGSVIYFVATIILTILWALLITIFMMQKARHKSILESIIMTVHTAFILRLKNVVLGLAFLLIGFVNIVLFGESFGFVVATIFVILGFIYVIPGVVRLSSILMQKTIGKIDNKVIFPLKNVSTNKIVLRSIMIISVSIALTISGFSVIASLDNFMNFARNNFNFDVIVGIDNNRDINVDDIRKLDSVEGMFSLSVYETELVNVTDDISENIIIIAREQYDGFNDFIYGSIRINEQYIEELCDESIVLDERLASRLNVSVGDTVRVSIGDENYSFFDVIGYCDSFHLTTLRNVAIISKSSFEKSFGYNLVDTIYVRAYDSAEETREDIFNALIDTEVVVWTHEDFFQSQIDNNRAMLQILMYILFLGLAICLFGIFNNIITDYLNRRKEFAVLISTSHTKKQLKGAILCETLVIAIINIMISLPMSFVMIYLINNVINSIGVIYVDLIFPTHDALLILLLSFCVIVALCSIPITMLNKLDVFKLLRQE